MNIKIRNNLVNQNILELDNRIPHNVKINGKEVRLTVGFSEDEKNNGSAGLMMYWHDRLIKSYYRIGIQTQNSDAANGIIGIFECNDLVPANNKQDYPDSKFYNDVEDWCSKTLETYYYQFYDPERHETDKSLTPELDWVQCDKCLKWRKINRKNKKEPLPKTWYCRFNQDKSFASCTVPQESTEGFATVKFEHHDQEIPTVPKRKRDSSSESESESSSSVSSGSEEETKKPISKYLKQEDEKSPQIKKKAQTNSNSSPIKKSYQSLKK